MNKFEMLINELELSTGTMRVDLLNTLATELSRRNLHQAIAYATEAIELSTTSGYWVGLAKGQLVLGQLIFDRDGGNTGAEDLVREALTKFESENDYVQLCQARTLLGKMLTLRLDFPRAEQLLVQSIDMLESKVESVEALIDGYGALLDLYRYSDNIVKGDALLRKALLFVNQQDNATSSIGYFFISVGHWSSYRQDYEAFAKYIYMASDYFDKIKDLLGWAICKMAVANVNTGIGSHQYALDHYQQAIEQLRALDVPFQLGYALCFCGRSLSELERDNEATLYLIEALRIAESINATARIFDSRRELAKTYVKLDRPGEALDLMLKNVEILHLVREDLRIWNYIFLSDSYAENNQLAEATDALNQAHDLMKNMPTFQPYPPDMLRRLPVLYAKMGDYESAYHYSQERNDVLKRTYNSRLSTEIKRLEDSLRSKEEREKELEEIVRKRTAELERAVNELTTSKERIQDLYEYAPDMYLSIDGETNQILNCNQTLLNELGYEKHEVVGRSVSDFYYPDSHEISKTALDVSRKTGIVPYTELQVVKKDGSLIYVSLRATAVVQFSHQRESYIRMAWRDITERKQAEAQLRKSEALFRTLVHSLPTLMTIKNTKGEFQYASPKTLAYFGVSSLDDLIGKTDFDLMPQDIAKKFYQDEQEIIRTGRAKIEYEERSVNPSIGEARWSLSTKMPLRQQSETSDQDEITGLITVSVDITDLKIKEEQLQAINAELEAFTYSVSHDLRAPLRAVSSFSQIISQRYRDAFNTQGQHYLDNVIEASKQMENLIEDLLIYARMGHDVMRLQTIDLDVLLTNICNSFSTKSQETSTKIELPSDLPSINSNQSLLTQIFTNLLENALTYRHPGIAPNIVITCQQKDNHVIFAVCDNGIGIAPEYHEKIFNIFQRLHHDDEYPGTGIGLANVKKAVGLLKGSVWLESAVGEGTTFFVSLPIIQASNL